VAFARLASSVLLVAASGCGRTDSAGLVRPTPRVSAPASPVADAGQPPDAGEPPDAGPSVDLTLGQVMSCELDTEQALHAAARFVACLDDGTSMAPIMDAHEGFLLGSMDPFAWSLAGLPTGCGLWQCASRARTCPDLGICLRDTALDREPCRERTFSCSGDVLGVCLGPFVTPHIDCARLGARCEDGACVKGLGCRFGNGETLARCDRETGELTVCPDVSLDCAQWRDEPTSCASFYVQGEVPVPWCSPERVGNMAGAYDRPVDCRRGVVSFEVVTGRTLEYDCRANGYSGCTEAGCRL